MSVDDFKKDVAFSVGLLEEWCKKEPQQIREAVSLLARGVEHWKSEYYAEKEKALELSGKLNELSILSAGYLSKLQQQDEQLIEKDIEEQRDVHQKIDEALGNRRRARGFVDPD